MHYPNQESRKGIVWKEYGRNVQKIVDHILTIEDKENRTHYANICIELMRQLNPSTNKDTQEHTVKLWDHLFIMSDFKLEVDAPYTMPDPAILGKKPNRIPLPTHRLAYKHYGRNIELLIQEIIQKDDQATKEDDVIYLLRLMKRYYMANNKENVEDEVVLSQLKQMSKGQIEIPYERIQAERLLDITLKDSRSGSNSYRSTGDNPARNSGQRDFRKNTNSNHRNNSGKSFKKRSN